jgi:ABC-type transport system involved in multi-copper enzyme maturation permease subunit
MCVILAALACWVYTVVLFGPIDLVLFAQVGLLSGLYLWTTLAVTFLCSTLLKSQIAAGGLAFSVYAFTALLGIVPQIKAYLPGALVEGATKLALTDSADAGRAVVTSLILVLACFVAAYRVFERREL